MLDFIKKMIFTIIFLAFTFQFIDSFKLINYEPEASVTENDFRSIQNISVNKDFGYFKSYREIYNQENDFDNQTNTFLNSNDNTINGIYDLIEHKVPADVLKVCDSKNFGDFNTSEIIKTFYEINKEKIDQLKRNCTLNIGQETAEKIKSDLSETLDKNKEILETFNPINFFTGDAKISDYIVSTFVKEDISTFTPNTTDEGMYENEEYDYENVVKDVPIIIYEMNSRFEVFWETLRKLRWAYLNKECLNLTAENFPSLDKMIEIITKLKTTKCLIDNRIDQNNCINMDNINIRNCFYNSFNETLKNIMVENMVDLNFFQSNNKITGVLNPLKSKEWLGLLNTGQKLCDQTTLNFDDKLKIFYQGLSDELPIFNRNTNENNIFMFNLMSYNYIIRKARFLSEYCGFINEQTIRLEDSGGINTNKYKRLLNEFEIRSKELLKMEAKQTYEALKIITNIFENFIFTKTIERPYDEENKTHSFFDHKKGLIRKFIFERNGELATDAYFFFLKLLRYYESSEDEEIKKVITNNNSKYIGEVVVDVTDFIYVFERYYKILGLSSTRFNLITSHICEYIKNNSFNIVLNDVIADFTKINGIFETLWLDFAKINRIDKENMAKNIVTYCDNLSEEHAAY